MRDAVHSGGRLGLSAGLRFFVSKVSGAPRGGVGGTLEGFGLAILDQLRDCSQLAKL